MTEPADCVQLSPGEDWNLPLPPRTTPLVVVWPKPGQPAALLSFDTVFEWRTFILQLAPDQRLPLTVRAKYDRALRLLYLAWVDAALIKVAELVTMTALELALRDRYGFAPKGSRPSFGRLLAHMVRVDGLSDADIPMIQRNGGSVVGRITGSERPSLREIRNGLAHGDPLDGLPYSGLIELVRDLITYAYRSYIAEAGSALSSSQRPTDRR